MNSPNAEEVRKLGGRSLLGGRAARAERRQLRATGRIAIVSSALRDHLSDAHAVPPSKFVVTPNAIFPDDYTDAVDARRPAEVPAGAAVVGFVGSIFPWHGLDALIDAFASMEDAGRACHLVIVGDGAPVPALRERAERRGVAPRVHFTGNVAPTEVRSWLAGMDVAVMPRSNWYGSPVKIFEYGAMGLPIVATRNGPISEVLTDGEDGILVGEELDELRAALVRLLGDPALAHSMGSAFRAKVLSRHTWTHNAEAALRGHPDLSPGA